MKKQPFHLNSSDVLRQILEALAQCPLDGSIRVTIEKLPKSYTNQQRKAIHVYCRLLSDALNEGGFTIQEVLEHSVGRDWTQDTVKELLWRAIQIPMTDKKSTTELDRDEVGEIYETLNRHTSDIFGIGIPFPEKGNINQ